jgi:hypothetical protein
MHTTAVQTERVSYIGATRVEHFYTLHHMSDGLWYSETLDDRGNPEFHYGPLSSRGEAIYATESHLDGLTAPHRAPR